MNSLEKPNNNPILLNLQKIDIEASNFKVNSMILDFSLKKGI